MHWPTAGDFQTTRKELDDAVVALEEIRRRIEQPGQRVDMRDVRDLRAFIVSSSLWSRVMQQLLAEIEAEAVRWASWQTPATSKRTYGETYAAVEPPAMRRLEGAELEHARQELGLPPGSVAV